MCEQMSLRLQNYSFSITLGARSSKNKLKTQEFFSLHSSYSNFYAYLCTRFTRSTYMGKSCTASS